MTTLKDTLDALRELSLSELQSVQSRAMYLIGTKRREETRAQEVDRLIREHQETQGREDGAQWVQPASALDAYPHGAVVTHDTVQWRSTTPANVWAPGTSGWRALSEDGAPPAFVPPSGAHDAYQQGEQVTYDGQIFEAVRDGVVHSPSEYPDDWQLVEAEDDEPTEPDEDDDTGPDPDPEPEPESEDPEIPEWDPDGWAYVTGDLVTYQAVVYRVRQNHTSQAGWNPAAVPALYEPHEGGA